MTKPILCLDFDGVLHSYTSGWKGASEIPDAPVPGAMRFLMEASEHFQIAIFSSRSNQEGGSIAMQIWLLKHLRAWYESENLPPEGFTKLLLNIEWPKAKPAAMVTLDDRALTFDGTWPDIQMLKDFKPWNKKSSHDMRVLSEGADTSRKEFEFVGNFDCADGNICLSFGSPPTRISFTPPQAIRLAEALLYHAHSAPSVSTEK